MLSPEVPKYVDPGGDWPHTCPTYSKQSAATCWSRGTETTFWGTSGLKSLKRNQGVRFLEVCFWSTFVSGIQFEGFCFGLLLILLLFVWVSHVNVARFFNMSQMMYKMLYPFKHKLKAQVVRRISCYVYVCWLRAMYSNICFYDRLISKVVDTEFDTQTSGFSGGWTNKSIIGFMWFHY